MGDLAVYGPCCPGKPVVRRIRMGNQDVGVAGLDSILAKGLAMVDSPEEDIKEAMLKELRAHNYVPASAEDDYMRGLWEAFVAHRDQTKSGEAHMSIEVFGSGCPRCDTVEATVRDALAELGLRARIDLITDLDTMVRRGIESTPALVIDGEVKVAGRVPEPDEVRRILKGRRGR